MNRRNFQEVALALPMGVHHLEQVVLGVQDFARENRLDWQYITSPDTHNLPPSALDGWQGDAVIALVNTEEDAAVLSRLDCPVVNISGARAASEFPRVRLDYRSVGTMAAEHLLDRGFQRFAYYGIDSVWYSDQIQEGFKRRIERSGAGCRVFIADSTMSRDVAWQHHTLALEDWLQTLEPQTGVMAAHDPRAAMLIRACQRVRLRVPEDIAVIGMNNDRTTCELSEPGITSVARNSRYLGYQVGQLLSELLAGTEPPIDDRIIAPSKIVERSSTRTLAIRSRELERVISYIDANIERGFTVQDLCEHVRRSRRWLEYAFKKELRTTPHQFVSETRVKHAKRLLSDPKRYKLKQVASMSGFAGTKQMSVVFKRSTGTTPRQFRDGLNERRSQ